jgi:hypothetical protein
MRAFGIKLGIVAVLVVADGCTKEKQPEQGGPTKSSGVPIDSRMAEPRTTQDSLRKGVISVADASIVLLERSAAGARARVEVRFAPDRKGGKPITIQPEEREVVLRDDGTEGDSVASDGIFSALINLSAAELQSEQVDRPGRVAAQFQGRVQLPTQRVPSAAVRDLRRIALKFRVPLDIFAIVDPNLESRSLMINDPAVVRDPSRTFDRCTGTGTEMGKWTFGHLVTEMANQAATSISPSDFTKAWLAQWQSNQTVNTFTIPARAQITSMIIDPWIAASGGSGSLDLGKAPFRLLAIVNRVDLRENLVYGGGSAGEGRFVFEALDTRNGQCNPLPFTVIFEYGIHKKSCMQVKAWAKQWYDLRTIAPTDPSYAPALEAITEQFVAAGTNPSQLPNRNSISQVRTNERAIGIPWELREFGLDGTGHLASTTTKREPDTNLHNTDALVNWINANSAVIAAQKHSVPLSVSGTAFLASRAPIPGDNTGFFWGRGGDIPTANARFGLSVNTCSGCHTGETKTQFTHVKPQTGPPAALSGFLTGIDVIDPDTTDADNSTRHFDDLERRAADLDGLVNSICIRQIKFNNISRSTH